MAQYIRPDFWLYETTVLWAACLCVCACACVSLSVVIAAQLTRFGRTMGRMTKKSTHIVLGHSLVRSLVHSHRTLIRLLRNARLKVALLALSAALIHSCARSLAHSLAPKFMGKRFLFMN